MKKTLIVDDEKTIRALLTEVLQPHGIATVEASDGTEAIHVFKEEHPDVVLLDLKMPNIDGIEAMKQMKTIDPDVPIIIISAYGDIPTAVEAVKKGAYDFITKPLKIEHLLVCLNRALEKLNLSRQVKRLNAAMETSLEWLFGKSKIMKKIIKDMHQVALSDLSVVIQGETGTGKSFIARSIHNLSRRAEGPFITVDLGAIPENLIESELFGYEKGAFTGADRKKDGFFQAANGGTIFLDELENISPHVQAKILRAVEDKKIYPLGSTKPVDIDVRIIAATNKDLKEFVKKGRFREDLFFRLCEFVINLPPLRERIDDIPLLAERFIKEASDELKKEIKGISDEAMRLLIGYPWPGNVRELKNLIRRAVLFSENGIITPESIEFLIEEEDTNRDDIPLLPLKEVTAMVVRDAEIKTITRALKLTKGNKSKAASMLQIDYKTLLTKIKEYGIRTME